MDYQDNIHEKIIEKAYLLKICTIIMFTGHYPLHYTCKGERVEWGDLNQSLFTTQWNETPCFIIKHFKFFVFIVWGGFHIEITLDIDICDIDFTDMTLRHDIDIWDTSWHDLVLALTLIFETEAYDMTWHWYP